MSSARDAGFIAALSGAVEGVVRADESLARHSTYRIGGPATVLLPSHAEDVAAALRLARDHQVPWFALGLGSNLLFPDDGLDALVIRVGKGLDALTAVEDLWSIGAGLPQPLAAKRTAAAGWGGIHRMVGVPGSVGGGIVMNAGCHGAEWQDTVVDVDLIDTDGEWHRVPSSEAGFTYRRSNLGRVVVVGTRVRLAAVDPQQLEEETEALYRWRREGTPFNSPCCGSVFKNPVRPDPEADGPRTAGQFIEATGLKGLRAGGIEVSPMHANYFVNTGGGTAADVLALLRTVRQQVEDRWGVRLDPEVKVLGPDGTVVRL